MHDVNPKPRTVPRLPGRCSRGAAMVEFALVLPLFFLMFAVVVDGGLYLYRYLRVTHITGVVAREMATTTARELHELNATQIDCNVAAQIACNAVSRVYSTTGDALVKNVRFSVRSITPNQWGGLPLIVVEGQLSKACILCGFLPSSFSARTREVIALESGLDLGPGCPYSNPGGLCP